MKRPCEECLKYPMCKYKSHIMCTEMFNYAHSNWDYHETFMCNLKEVFPNAILLHLDNGKIPG